MFPTPSDDTGYTIHTHFDLTVPVAAFPYGAPPYSNPHQPSRADFVHAKNFPNMHHFLITNKGFIRYGSDGSIDWLAGNAWWDKTNDMYTDCSPWLRSEEE
jgi:hypothetical protein